MSAGIKGAHVGFNSRGTYTDVGIPGTGISSFQYATTARAREELAPSKPKRHIILKLFLFPFWLMWLELKVFYWLFKVLFKVVSFLFSKWYARQASVVETQTQLTTGTGVEPQPQDAKLVK